MVGFSSDPGTVLAVLDSGCEGGLGPAESGGQELAGLGRVVVDGLLAHQDQLRFESSSQFGEDTRDVPGVQRFGGVDADRPVGSHGQGRPQFVLVRLASDPHHHDFDIVASFLQPQCLLDGDRVEGVDHEREVRGIDFESIGGDSNHPVGIGDSLGRNQHQEAHAVDPSSICP